MSAPLVADLETEIVDLAILKPHPENPRKHPKKGSPKWEALRKSLAADYFDPLVYNRRNGMLVSGHLRCAMLIDMGFTSARVVVKDYDDAMHRARMIAANTLLGEFEETLLGQLATSLDTTGIDAALAGLTDKQLMALVDGPTTVDDAEQTSELVCQAELLQQKWQVQLGDLFQIGNHRLLCGDCASQDNWQLLLQGSQVDMFWTDPPYNIDYEALQTKRNELNVQRGKTSNVVPQAILNDDVTDKEYAALLQAWFGAAAAVTKPGGVIYIAHADCYRLLNEAAAVAAGFYIAQNLVWVKSGFTLGRQDYQWQHEPILYGWRKGAAHYWQGGFNKATLIDDERDLSKLPKADLIVLINQMRNDRGGTVIRHPRNTSAALHPTIKPIKLVADQIWNSSQRGETVGELFGGSGTTLAAAEQTGRRCVATELDPKYCAVILERLGSYGLTIEKIHHRS